MIVPDIQKEKWWSWAAAHANNCDFGLKSIFRVFTAACGLPVLYDPVPAGVWGAEADQAFAAEYEDDHGRIIFHIICQEPTPACIIPILAIVHEPVHKLMGHMRTGKLGYGGYRGDAEGSPTAEEEANYLAFSILVFSQWALNDIFPRPLNDDELVTLGMTYLRDSFFWSPEEVRDELRRMRAWHANHHGLAR